MKKNISINISGIIFHIEEDGYENLRKYLDSINKYFSTFEDSSEILADIESRIAEIFLSKLNEGKQIITTEDVNSLIATMGSVNDFKAAEGQEFKADQQTASAAGDAGETFSSSSKYLPPKRLLRDQKRKIMGGVCAGLASYLNVDAVWIRLLFAISTFAYGVTFIAYLIMWAAVPGSYDLEEPEVKKKMFRDPKNKVLGGVSGGVATFLGIDIIIVRVLFIVITIVGGLGLVVYIVLWVVIPEAKTLTDKMQMEGQPVTLSNIESNIKKNQSITGNEEESALTKILLFPFRLIGLILTSLSKVFGPLVDVFRIIIGIAITFLGLSMILTTIVTGGVVFGIFSGWSALPIWGSEVNEIGFPVEMFSNTIPSFTTFAAFIALLVPALFIVLLGISIIAKRIVFAAIAGWTLFVLFFVSVLVLGLSVPKIIFAFQRKGDYKIENVYQPTGKTLTLKVNEAGLENYRVTDVALRGYDGKDVKLVQSFEAQGSNRQTAIENAHMIDYHVDFKDSVLTFDSNITFKKDAKFRAQRLNISLYIPYDLPFVMDEEARRFVTNTYNDDSEDSDLSTWKMTRDGLKCVSCPPSEQSDNDGMSFNNFNTLDINGVVDVTITQGADYRVELVGSDSEKEKYTVSQNDQTLVIDFEDHGNSFWKNLNLHEMHINITMPELYKLEAQGAGKIDFRKFTCNDFNVEIRGAMKVKGDIDAQNIDIEITGASELELSGKGQKMDASIEGASSMNAYNFEVVDARVDADGASHAKVNVTGKLDMDKGFASDIDYHGHPQVINENEND